MNSKWHAHEIMTQGPFCAESTTKLQELTRELVERKLTSAPVISPEGLLVGFVSLVDVAVDAVLLTPGSSERVVKDIMQHRVYTLDPGDTVPTIIEKFKEFEVHHLVVTHNERVMGVLSLRDLLGNLSENSGYPVAL